MAQSIAAEVLREARSQASLSQSELADAAGTYQSVVGRIEAGKTSPSLDTLARMVNAAGFELKFSLEPADVKDPVIEAYKPGVDQTLLIENLRRSIDERLQNNAAVNYFTEELRRGVRAKRVAEEPND
jgi:transcriptional regulator with XRE-family HTH domain